MSKSSELYHWFIANDKYFNSGTWLPTEIFVMNENLKFDEIAMQNRMHGLDTALENCKDCEQNWHAKHSLRSWYRPFTNWVSVGFCSRMAPSSTPGEKIVVPQAEFYTCLSEWFASY